MPVSIDSGSGGQSHLAEINIELLGAEYRDISSVDIGNKWRNKVGEIPDVSSLTFTSEFVMTGNAIEIELSHDNFDTLLQASERFQEILRNYSGITDIADDFEPGKPELKLQLKDTGRSLGLTLSDLARKIRQAFYGEEIQRVQRGRDDIRVMSGIRKKNARVWQISRTCESDCLTELKFLLKLSQMFNMAAVFLISGELTADVS